MVNLNQKYKIYHQWTKLHCENERRMKNSSPWRWWCCWHQMSLPRLTVMKMDGRVLFIPSFIDTACHWINRHLPRYYLDFVLRNHKTDLFFLGSRGLLLCWLITATVITSTTLILVHLSITDDVGKPATDFRDAWHNTNVFYSLCSTWNIPRKHESKQ